MNCLECGICHIQYNEDEHRPRTSQCGHEFCSTCLKALINDGEYICPKCREKFKVTTVEDLPVVYGLIDVIRAFRANSISLPKEADSRNTGATNEEVCSIHSKAISHYCFNCLIWICVDCCESHTSLTGCLATTATEAMEDLKDDHNTSVDQLLAKFTKDTNHIVSKIEEHTNKRKEHLEIADKHGEEIKELQFLLQQGIDYKMELEKSSKTLNETISPIALCDSIKVMTQRKQTLISWAAKNIGTRNIEKDTLPETKQELLQVLENGNNVHVEKFIKGVKRYSHLKKEYDGNIYVHTYTFQAQYKSTRFIVMPVPQLKKIIPSDASLVFLELSLQGSVVGKVHIGLDNTLPNTRKYVVQLIMGEFGCSLKGETLSPNANLLKNLNLELQEFKFTPDKNGHNKTKKGDVFGKFNNGYLEHLVFQLNPWPLAYGSSYYVFGNIEVGMEVLQKCYDNHNQGDIKITDCGLII